MVLSFKQSDRRNGEAMSESILSYRQGAVQIIELARADKKNALSQAMYLDLAKQLGAADSDPEVRVILLKGQAEIFCAGNDLTDFVNAGPDAFDPVLVFMRSLYQLKKPIIAAVAGAAVGIGATLLLHCDLVYASPGARLAFPFVQLGVCPEFGSSRLLPKLLGHQRASELLLLGGSVDATRAVELGLVNEVLDDAELIPHAIAQAQRLAMQPAAAVLASKRLLKGAERDILALFEEEARAFLELLGTEDSQQLIAKMISR